LRRHNPRRATRVSARLAGNCFRAPDGDRHYRLRQRLDHEQPSVRQLYLLQTAMKKATGSHLGRDFLAGEMASGSASVQVVAGLAAIVLGILAVTGTSSIPVALAALLVLGVTIILTGSTLSGLVLGLMRPAPKAT